MKMCYRPIGNATLKINWITNDRAPKITIPIEHIFKTVK